jgi:hypothetical protein
VTGKTGSNDLTSQGGKEAAAGLAVARNPAGRWEWILQFEDDVVLPSKRVSDEDYASEEEALAAGELARSQFVRRGAEP